MIKKLKIKNQKLKIIIRKIKNFLHLFEAIIANLYYGFPSRKIKVIGVTGTDGKTTTTHLIYHLLKSAGRKVSMISTIYAKVGDKEFDTGLHTTTPNSLTIQKFLKQAVNNGDQYFILETTSHALDQNRVWGIDFEIGVLTNISHEHLDYHQTYENYLKTKLRLLLLSKIALINQEDQSYFEILSKLKDKKIQVKKYNSKIKILKNFNWLTTYNKQNYAAAYTVCHLLNLTDKEIINGMRTFKLPRGRLEVVYDKDFKVVVDFAHTPNAFSVLLPEIKKRYLNNGGKIIHVFGCAGLRDWLKRPMMGKISSQYADVIILTEEDYRTENIYKIFEQIESGFNKSKIKNQKLKIYRVLNRQEAIIKAISLAKKGDVVLITGKAHEKSLCRGKKEYPWDEFEVIRKAIQLIINK